MVSKKLYYITRARIPSEKAHSFQIMKMCQAYASLGYAVQLVVPKRQNTITTSAFTYFNVPETFSITYVDVPGLIRSGRFGRIFFWLEGIFFLGQLWRHALIDKDVVIISRSVEVALFYSLRRFKRVIFEIHDWPQSGQRFFGLLLRRIPKVVVTARGLLDECIAVGVQALLAPNGVDESFFTSFVLPDKASLNIPSDKKVVMYIGALATWKGVDTLMEASKKLSADYQVVVAGGQPVEIAELSVMYPKVVFLGQTPTHELVRYQALADVLVVPNSAREMMSSRYTSPIKLFAHLTSRRPIIVADLPSMRAIVSEKEVVFFDGSVEGLVETIKYVLALDSSSIAVLTEAAFQKSLQFTWTKRARSIIDFVSSAKRGDKLQTTQ